MRMCMLVPYKGLTPCLGCTQPNARWVSCTGKHYREWVSDWLQLPYCYPLMIYVILSYGLYQSFDYYNASYPSGGQKVKKLNRWDGVKSILHFLASISREWYKQKITKYFGCGPCVIKTSDFTKELKVSPLFDAVEISRYNYLVLASTFNSNPSTATQNLT